MGRFDLHHTEAMTLTFLWVPRPPGCFCGCQIATCIIACKQRGKRKGGGGGGRQQGDTHMWKFNVRAAPWNEDVGFGMKIAISWLL